MPKDSSIKHVLIIGSGPIIIGQACEFDYSGSQAAQSLTEEGIEVSLINSNPATIMTDPTMADHIYLLPLTTDSISKILKEQNITHVLPTMGGQTALNLAIEADEIGIWEEHGVKIIGVDIAAIEKTENRDLFRSFMLELDIPIATSKIANSYLEAKEVAQEIGFPLVIRPSFTMGGYGGGFVHAKEEFDEAVKRGLEASPTHEVLVEQAVLGWKEYELELLRDGNDNIAVICTIENFDPMGIHTGESITVAPAMTLSDTCFQEMRNMAFRMMRNLGTFAGGCNVQFSVNPEDEQIIAIEINPRVSRSSALASKATGYPIANIAAKLALGYYLDELKNPVTKTTSAFFEPSIDYTIVKIPRWDFNKFKGADRTLGLQMKSVGEVMAIGRSFQEALQKACQSLELKRQGIGADGYELKKLEPIIHSLENPSWDRIFHIRDAMALGVPITSIQKITKIDRWFLEQIYEIVKTEKEIKKYTLENIDVEILKIAKEKGFADSQIAHLLGGDITDMDVYDKRTSLGVNRIYKMVDTCAAEFSSPTNYMYSTFDGENESVVSDKKKILVIGSGPNRIGQGIEFDYSCVHGIKAAQELGYEAIMINCNPETVSTDFNTADKLYFEPIFWEHLWDVIQLEKPEGVIVQLGGQTALKLSARLRDHGIKIMGTSYENMDLAEDRGSFSNLLKELDIPYPRFGVAEDAYEAIQVANEVGYPVLVRPSYVLGGQGMKIVINDEDLQAAVIELLGDLPGNRVLIDHFLDRAEEAESDSICDGEDVEIIGIMEHIEPAGIHSGDSSAVLPPFDLSENVIKKIEEYSAKIARAMNVVGLLNIQFAVKDEHVYVIEANPRASRTVPFICKAYQVPYVNIATKVMLGDMKLKDFDINPIKKGYAIKQPVFSFNKFPNVNKELGPEMKSTGEAILFVDNIKDPVFRDLYSQKSMFLSR
ncbi:MAG: carbamoyl-phosphate synthase large subunit [Bacteroidia bacterium]|nr:carbamoyl-phosphate synthase large subunit [Bacteroidia bacterium]NNJ55578.1 carbamoyl-phosphate synthase large subunit [Bacteroidia bacterium]